MSTQYPSSQQRAISRSVSWSVSWIVTLCTVLVSLLPASMVQASAPTAALAVAPAETAAVSTVTLDSIDDARTQSGSPTTNFGSGYLWVGQPNIHYSFVQFDLSTLPADATIVGAGLRLDFTGAYTGTNDVEVGRAEGAWDELTLTWSTQPSVTWGGPVQTVTSTDIHDSSLVTWNVTSLVNAWHEGTQPNYGFALRGKGGELKAFRSKETTANGNPPQLVIAYTVPADDGQPRPDLGDAPDSTNHHGQNNTAYVAGAVLGQFPTVWDVPAGQVAGPRHANQTMEGWLGNYISGENEADQGPDQDAPRNNILRNTVTGNVANVADNDRGDDGWRNRNIKFFDCQRQSLDVRISKSANATKGMMYLNVWFDGNHDGDWQDIGQCQQNEEEPAQASYEWIVQNYIIDMTVIPAGGSYDYSIITEKVLNSSPALRHWMRFTLSEEPAVQPVAGGLPDGRGPHPTSALGAYKYGETEDVLQSPPPPGEDGTLRIEKSVIGADNPVDYAGTVTYRIRLHNEGGTQPVQAQIRDVLGYPQHVLPQISNSNVVYVKVSSPTGGVTPLQATLDYITGGSAPVEQIVKWQGTMAPDAIVVLEFDVHVHPLCSADQNTATIRNIAQAKPKGGTLISDEATFVAKCPGYSPNNVQINSDPIAYDIDLDQLTQLPWSGRITNTHPISVSLGFYQKPTGSNLEASAAGQLRMLGTVDLGPNESRSVEDMTLNIEYEKVANELDLAEDFSPAINFGYCFLPGEATDCPDVVKFPNLHGQIPFTLTVRPNDLGDAPDSSNHAGANMLAYPGVQADFPTVFDPATGLPVGPRHSFPGPFHLGQRVSREAEADLGPDQDPLNNILPAANNPDNDRGDDGTNLALWNLNNCQTTNLPVQVAIWPAAVNYFQQLGTTAYLNIWIDSNRDGDWADAAQCNQNPAPEHIVIDFPVDVVALGAGLQNLNVPTGLVPWTVNDKPAWVRISLSERPSNKTLPTTTAPKYGDGRGYVNPFKTGETEDYYYRPITAGGGPDLDVQLTAKSRKATERDLGMQAAAVDGKLGNFEIQDFKIDYGNVGSANVTNALLEFQIPEKLRGGQLKAIKAPGISADNISFTFDKLTFKLPDLTPGKYGPIVLSWYGCITCTVAASDINAANVDYTAKVIATVPGDVDTSNNEKSVTLRGLLSSPIIGAFMDYTDDACMDRILMGPVVTNKTTVELRGKAEPNSIIAILIGLLKAGEVQSDADGNFIYSANIGQGLHVISAKYANGLSAADANVTSPRDSASGLATGRVMIKVDPSLPFDPMSVCFVDSNNRSYALPTLGYSFGATQTGSWLKAGETYHVSLNSTTGNLNQSFKVTFNDIVISSLLDENMDGTFVGMATFPASVQAASVNAAGTLGLIVGDGTNESSYSAEFTSTTSGVVSGNGQPVANASVALLAAQGAEDGTVYFEAASVSESNPQVTGSDGSYSFGATSGIYRIDVSASGYQPYHSNNIDASAASLTPNIKLSPVVNEATTQTIYITDSGYEPASLTVTPGSVVEFVNIGLDDHASSGSNWDSGMLTTGSSYKVMLNNVGSFSYGDSANPLNQGTIIVTETSEGNSKIFLPLVSR